MASELTGQAGSGGRPRARRRGAAGRERARLLAALLRALYAASHGAAAICCLLLPPGPRCTLHRQAEEQKLQASVHAWRSDAGFQAILQ